jgi:hypothetical protein
MTYAFYFKDNHYCADCIVEVVIAAGLAPRSAQDQSPDAVLIQVAAEKGIDLEWPDGFTGFVFPKAIFPVPPALSCEGCGGRLVEPDPTESGEQQLTPADELRLDGISADLADLVLAHWAANPTPAESCADVAVVAALRAAVKSSLAHHVHKALLAGASVTAVAAASGLSLYDLEVTWHLWAAEQLRIDSRGPDGRPLVSYPEAEYILAIFRR